MNKIFKVKRNSAGQSVVCSEKSRTRGKPKALVAAVVVASMSATGAIASTVYQTTAAEMKLDDRQTILIGQNLRVETETGYPSFNTVIGSNSNVYDLSKSISLGDNNTLGSASTIDNGNQPQLAIAIGSNNTVTAQAIGIGDSTKATNSFAIAIGQKGSSQEGTQATGFGSIALGGHARALGENIMLARTIAIGQLSLAEGGQAIAIGGESQATGNQAVALGNGSKASAEYGMALGALSAADHARSVSIGAFSRTENATRTNSARINNQTYQFSGESRAVVSVGNETFKRQIVNVAAGRVTSDSTDAINGSQLFAVADNMGNLANSIKTELGGNAALSSNGTITMTNIGGTGQDNIHDAIAFVNAKQGTLTNVVSGDGIVVTDSTTNGEKTFTVGLAPAVKADVAKGIADAAKAQTVADQAVADVKVAQNTANSANATANRVAATTYTFSVANGQTAATTTTGTADTWRTTAADSLTLGATTDLSVSTDGAGKVIYGLSDATKANITKAQTDAAKGIADAKAADAKAVAAQNTANTAVTKADAAQSTANKAVADIKTLDDIAVKYDSTAKDTITLAGADGTTITNIKAGAISANSTDAVNGGQLYALTEKVNNLDATDVVAGRGVTVTKSTQGNLNTYTVSVSNATLSDIAKAQADATKGIADAAAAQNTANTAVTKADAAQSTANKAVADIKTLDDIAVKYDNATKNTVTLGGLDGTTITNVKDGAITADSKDVVNGSQLYVVKSTADAAKLQANANAVEISRLDNQKADKSALTATDAKVKANADNIAKGLNISTDEGATTNHQLGSTVTILGGKNINTATVNGAVSVSLKDSITVQNIAIQGSDIGMSANGMNAGNKKISNVADATIAANSKDAVNGGQLHNVYQYVDKIDGSLRNHINQVEDELQAGVAGSNAAAALPQVRNDGKSMLAFAMGAFEDKGALAVGYSRASDNGKTVFKAHLNANTENKFGGGVGMGFEW